MPRKPWIKLSTHLTSSSTWKATRKVGRDAFFAMLTLADDEGIVSAMDVSQLSLTCFFSLHTFSRQRIERQLRELQEAGTIDRREDGSIKIYKYSQYQKKHEKTANPEKGQEEKRVEEKKDKEEIPEALEKYRASVEEWLAYKRERREGYKERGLKALFTKMIEMGSGLPGAVKSSMSSNYAGLFPDKNQDKVEPGDLDANGYPTVQLIDKMIARGDKCS